MLTRSQINSYQTDGYLLASGLIPDDISAAAEARMWSHMEMDPDDPETWSRVPDGAHEYVESRGVVIFNALQDDELMACATPEYMIAVSQLIGESVERHPPQAIHTQNLLKRDIPSQEPRPHVDGIPKEHMHRTFPGPYRIASLIYLSDIEPQGGGTAIWPGSHRKIRELAESDPIQYEYLHEFNKDIPSLDLGDPTIVEPKRGDVLFFQHLLGHNGTANGAIRPRFMIRYFCKCQACFGRWKKTDEWGHWTP